MRTRRHRHPWRPRSNRHGAIDPHAAEDIEIQFVDGRPDTETHLFILGGYAGAVSGKTGAHVLNFFTTHQSAQAWVGANDLEGEIVPVTDITAEAAEM